MFWGVWGDTQIHHVFVTGITFKNKHLHIKVLAVLYFATIAHLYSCFTGDHEACRQPPRIPHAVITNQVYKELFNQDSEVQYQCEDGYTLLLTSNNNSIFCISGNWTEGPTCSKYGDSSLNTHLSAYMFALKGASHGKKYCLFCICNTYDVYFIRKVYWQQKLCVSVTTTLRTDYVRVYQISYYCYLPPPTRSWFRFRTW